MKNKELSKKVLFVLKFIIILSFILFILIKFTKFHLENRQSYQFIQRILDIFIYFDIFLCFSITIFLLIKYENKEKNVNINKTKILNIADYQGTKESDVALLEKVLQGFQYKNIAFETKRAEGTIRNRLNKLYDILGVYDRMGFISSFTGYTIIFNIIETL